MWQYFLLGLGLMLVLEGILPFIMPEHYKHFMRKMSEQSVRALRMTGFILMLAGVAILVAMKRWFGI